MSEHITHLAVAEDSARLAVFDSNFHPRLRAAVQRYPEALRLGSTTRSGDFFIFPLLKEWRENWRGNDDPRAEHLAYVIGWAGHLAGDRTFKPVFRITDLSYYVRGFPGPSHASVYQDAATFHHVYADGQREPFHPAILSPELSDHPAAANLPVRHLESALGSGFAHRMAAFRSFPGEAVTDEWDEQFKYLNSERQRFYVALDRYSEASRNPDPTRQRQYLLQPNFYNPDDALLRLVGNLREGKTPTVNLAEALADADNQSLYAQSLALGHQFHMAASDYFGGKITEDVARVRMRTGKAHKQSLEYYVEQAKKRQND